MTRHTARRAISAGLAAGFAGGILLGPISPTHATPTPAADAASCTVDSAELSWGVKERFRNYISGSIANGEWIIGNGTTYETPSFSWANGTGQVSPDLSSGEVSFTGDIFFTGHGGLMQLELQDPVIVFTGPKSAELVLGMGSSDVEGAELAIEPVTAALIDVSGADLTDGSRYTVENAPVQLTEEGAAAFNSKYGDYVTGEKMDGASLSLAVSGCEMSADTGTAPAPEEAERPGVPIEESPGASREIPWVAIVVGGIAVIASGVTGGMLLAGRKRKNAESEPLDAESSPEDSH